MSPSTNNTTTQIETDDLGNVVLPSIEFGADEDLGSATNRSSDEGYDSDKVELGTARQPEETPEFDDFGRMKRRGSKKPLSE